MVVSLIFFSYIVIGVFMLVFMFMFMFIMFVFVVYIVIVFDAVEICLVLITVNIIKFLFNYVTTNNFMGDSMCKFWTLRHL